jgi:hypothetical protein
MVVGLAEDANPGLTNLPYPATGQIGITSEKHPPMSTALGDNLGITDILATIEMFVMDDEAKPCPSQFVR